MLDTAMQRIIPPPRKCPYRRRQPELGNFDRRSRQLDRRERPSAFDQPGLRPHPGDVVSYYTAASGVGKRLLGDTDDPQRELFSALSTPTAGVSCIASSCLAGTGAGDGAAGRAHAPDADSWRPPVDPPTARPPTCNRS
jgi:hypothetical protein